MADAHFSTLSKREAYWSCVLSITFMYSAGVIWPLAIASRASSLDIISGCIQTPPQKTAASLLQDA